MEADAGLRFYAKLKTAIVSFASRKEMSSV